jgi:hypothetical protein
LGSVTVEKIGLGELVWIPSRLKGISAEQLGFNARLKSKLGLKSGGAVTIDHRLLLSCLRAYQPSLAVFHWISEDSELILERFLASGVPVTIVNHFDNSRLNHRSIRKQIARATSVAGVCGIDVPRFLKGRFTELTDAIDTEFFSLAEPWYDRPRGNPLSYFLRESVKSRVILMPFECLAY